MRLVCLGDSLTFGYKMKRQDTWPALLKKKYGIEVLNMGLCGDTTTDLACRFHTDVVERHPSHVIIMGGSNDFIQKVPFTVPRLQIESLVSQSRENGIEPIVGVPIPVDVENAQKYWPDVDNFEEVSRLLKPYRKWLQDFGAAHKCRVIDFFSLFYDFKADMPKTQYYLDGLHPTVEGNRLMAEAVEF